MILADSSILIEFQRAPTSAVNEIITRRDVVVVGVTRAEILAGVRNERDRVNAVRLLLPFRRLPLDERIWDRTGEIAARLRVKGRPLPLGDTVIAAAAIHNEVPLWTRDRDFLAIQAVAPELVIFDEGAG